MFGQMLSALMLLAAGQVAPEAGLLEVVPAKADVVVRVRTIAGAKADLAAMIAAMSPRLAESAGPALDTGLAQLEQMTGKDGLDWPFLTVIRVVSPQAGKSAPFAVVVPTDVPEQVLSNLPGGLEERKTLPGGYDSYKLPNGETYYTTQAGGWLAFGPDESLVAAMHGDDPKLASALTDGQKTRFLAGDAGLAVNAAALTARYAEEIEQGRAFLMATLDQAAAQAGNAQAMDMAKSMYGGMFDGIKQLDRLTMSIDASAEGLALGGEVTMKSGSEAASLLTSAKQGTADDLASLPSDLWYYIYMNLAPDQMARMQAWGLSAMGGAGLSGPALEQAIDAMKGMGPIEMSTAYRVGKGMTGISVLKTTDPKAYMASTLKVMESMKGIASDPASPLGIVKETTIEPDAATHAGYSFTRVTIVFDLEKLQKMAGANPAARASTEAMLGGDRLITWIGTDGEQVLSVNAKDEAEAKLLVDSLAKPSAAAGNLAGFQAVRKKLPAEVTGLMMISAQGFVKQILSQVGAMLAGGALEPPKDMPADPAFLGMSVSATPESVGFDLVVPSTVGPVFEKGIAPILGIAGGGQIDR